MKETLEHVIQIMVEFATTMGARLLGSIVILVIGARLIKWLVKLVNRGKKIGNLPLNIKALISSMIKITLYLLLIVVIASTLGIETASISAAIASAGLAIGLALQGSFTNFAGGIMILLFHPFSIGDFIDDGTHAGTVTDIGVFYTTLLTPDNKIVTIPNGTLSNSSVTDFSAKETRRLDLDIGVGYECDIDLVRTILLDLASADERIIKEPAPVVYLKEHAESALIFSFRVWVKGSDYWNVRFDLLEKSKKAFDLNGISIPFKQIDIHLDK